MNEVVLRGTPYTGLEPEWEELLLSVLQVPRVVSEAASLGVEATDASRYGLS